MIRRSSHPSHHFTGCSLYAVCVVSACSRCRNIGTGKNCAAASDAAGGPTCQGSQIGLCCSALESSQNCLTLLGDGSDPRATLGQFVGDRQTSNPTVPACSQIQLGGQALSPFCCDEMDLPNCDSAAVESQGSPADLIARGQGCVVGEQN